VLTHRARLSLSRSGRTRCSLGIREPRRWLLVSSVCGFGSYLKDGSRSVQIPYCPQQTVLNRQDHYFPIISIKFIATESLRMSYDQSCYSPFITRSWNSFPCVGFVRTSPANLWLSVHIVSQLNEIRIAMTEAL
jgi:hypothetical protein